jgi:hypothetical protein
MFGGFMNWRKNETGTKVFVEYLKEVNRVGNDRYVKPKDTLQLKEKLNAHQELMNRIINKEYTDESNRMDC